MAWYFCDFGQVHGVLGFGKTNGSFGVAPDFGKELLFLYLQALSILIDYSPS